MKSGGVIRSERAATNFTHFWVTKHTQKKKTTGKLLRGFSSMKTTDRLLRSCGHWISQKSSGQRPRGGVLRLFRRRSSSWSSRIQRKVSHAVNTTIDWLPGRRRRLRLRFSPRAEIDRAADCDRPEHQTFFSENPSFSVFEVGTCRNGPSKRYDRSGSRNDARL